MIVAIGRELGAGGHEVGERIAAMIGAELLDNQIVDLVAQKIGAPAAYVAAKDETVETFAERLFRSIRQAQPEAYAASADIPDWSEDRLFALTSDIIRERAREHALVVIGRGAPILLKNMPGLLRLFVVAPMDARVRRLAERTGVSAEEASRQIKASDQRRAAYMKQYFGADWRDPHQYDLVVNSGVLGVEQAARIAVECLRIIAPRPGWSGRL